MIKNVHFNVDIYSRFRKQACEFPELAEKDRFQAIHQEIVKMESIPDQSTDLYE